MGYRLVVTDNADCLLDECIGYLLYKFKSNQAASHLLDSVHSTYEAIEKNPYIFPESKDANLKRLGYREAVIIDMDYIILYRIENSHVYIVGIFHTLEDYRNKI